MWVSAVCIKPVPIFRPIGSTLYWIKRVPQLAKAVYGRASLSRGNWKKPSLRSNVEKNLLPTVTAWISSFFGKGVPLKLRSLSSPKKDVMICHFCSTLPARLITDGLGTGKMQARHVEHYDSMISLSRASWIQLWITCISFCERAFMRITTGFIACIGLLKVNEIGRTFNLPALKLSEKSMDVLVWSTLVFRCVVGSRAFLAPMPSPALPEWFCRYLSLVALKRWMFATYLAIL